MTATLEPTTTPDETRPQRDRNPGDARGFLTVFLSVIFVLFVLPLILNYIVLMRSGEMLSYPQIAERQLAKDSLYGSAISGNAYAYKQELLGRLRPDILAVGSSRVLQFRGEFFNRSFGSTGGAMGDIHAARMFLDDLLKTGYRPKLVILGLDFWWFNADYNHEPDYPQHRQRSDTLTIEKLRKPAEFLWEGRLKPGDYFKILAGIPPVPIRKDLIGLGAWRSLAGFRRDGTYAYDMIFKPHPKETHFKSTLASLDNKGGRWYGTGFKRERLAELKGILHLLDERHIPVIVMLSPVSPTLYERMTSHPEHAYDYVAELRRELPRLPYEYYDFQDPAAVGTPDCEFVDGIHGGNVTYARLLVEMLRRNPHSSLKPYVNEALLRRKIAERAGHTLIPFSAEDFYLPEIDHLSLGCRR